MATKHSRRDAAQSDNVLIELHLMFGKLESDKQSQVVEVSTSLYTLTKLQDSAATYYLS